MIRLENISVSFADKVVFDNFSFTFPKKGVVLVTGPSGCGKTTLSKIILGTLKADDGSVVRECEKMSVVFQEDRLVPTLTAFHNVELVSNKTEAKKRLEQMKLSDSADKFPSELSGGMNRRVAIARALAYGGDVLILDEAFTGIDDKLAREIIGEICKEYKEKLIIAVSHHPEIFSEINHTICQI